MKTISCINQYCVCCFVVLQLIATYSGGGIIIAISLHIYIHKGGNFDKNVLIPRKVLKSYPINIDMSLKQLKMDNYKINVLQCKGYSLKQYNLSSIFLCLCTCFLKSVTADSGNS